MKHSLLFLLLSLTTYAQQTFVVKNEITKEPIVYGSIYTTDGTFKINSEKDGSFIIPNEFLEKTFVFDAVGFELKEGKLTSETTITTTIYLNPKSEILEEVVIIPMKQTKTLKVGQIKRSNFTYGSNAGAESWSFGRYFPYEKNMEETPFLKEVRFDLISEKKPSTYGIRIYETDEEGFPVKLLHDDLIIGKAKKGSKVSITDISDLKIIIPKKGVLVVFEWINIEENYYEYNYNYVFEAKRHIRESCNPRLKTMPTDTFEFSFSKTKSWGFINYKNSFYEMKNNSKPYAVISCEIILTN